MKDFKFSEGQRVVKTQGYPFDGIVDVAFRSQAGVERYVIEKVELDEDGDPFATGLMHIFAPEQLRADERYDSTGELYDEGQDLVDSQIPVRK